MNPRGGRSSSLIFGLLAFVVYNNMLNLGQGWISMGMVSFSHFLIVLHGGVFLSAVAWLVKRNSNWVLRPAPRLQRPPIVVRNNALVA